MKNFNGNLYTSELKSQNVIVYTCFVAEYKVLLIIQDISQKRKKRDIQKCETVRDFLLHFFIRVFFLRYDIKVMKFVFRIFRK